MITGLKRSSWHIHNKTRDTMVATNAIMVRNYWGCLLGLFGYPRRWAQLGNGLWIVSCHIVHTVGLTFPIDVIFLAADNSVLRIEEYVRPYNVVKVSLRASSFLQLPPHSIYRTETKVGDIIEITPRSNRTES
jgi:uncharacterized protein